MGKRMVFTDDNPPRTPEISDVRQLLYDAYGAYGFQLSGLVRLAEDEDEDLIWMTIYMMKPLFELWLHCDKDMVEGQRDQLRQLLLRIDSMVKDKDCTAFPLHND